MASHLASLRNRSSRQLGNGLFRLVENLCLPLREKLEASTIKAYLSMVNKDLEECV